mgnify:CR=1 FL=1
MARRLGISHQNLGLIVDRAMVKTPFPYLGDLRLFVSDKSGAYCVNWPVKNKYEDFKLPGPRSSLRALSDNDDAAAVARHRLELEYHADAGIRTHPVALEVMDRAVCLNLRNVFLDDSYPVPLSAKHRKTALEMARSYVGVDVPAYQVARRIAKEFRITERDAIALLHQGIWRRELHVDLFEPFLMPSPMRPQVVDPVDHYAEMFAR